MQEQALKWANTAEDKQRKEAVGETRSHTYPEGTCDEMIIVWETEIATRVQIVGESAYNSHYNNTPRKSMHSTIYPALSK